MSKRDNVDFDSLSPDELDGMLGIWLEDDLDPNSKCRNANSVYKY